MKIYLYLFSFIILLLIPLYFITSRNRVFDLFPKKSNIYIHYWADWCEPCLDELPNLDKKLKNIKEYKILYTVDSSKKTLKILQKLNPVNFDTIIFENQNNKVYFNSKFFHQEKKVMPRNLVLNKSKIIYKSLGVDPEITLRIRDTL